MNGLLLFTLDRLYRVVERHAKAAGEWQWVKEGRTCGFCERVPSLQLFWLFGLGVANIYEFFLSAYPATGSFSMSAIESGVKLVYLELSWVLSSAQLSYS
nr:protein DGS1, mitochondrial [Tanacetum cinerariifolium]